MEWYGQMKQQERRTFWACFGGWALDAMDVQMYAVVVPTLIAIWGMTKAQAGLVGTVTLIVSSIGGWIAGILADRLGRVRVLQITILWFSAFTFLSGLTTSFGQMLAARALQGFGFGGEWAAGAVLIAETVQAKYRGKAVACVQSGWSVGYGAAALLFTLIFNVFPAQQAWRYLFFAGLVPALLVFFVRRYVNEPQVYVATRKKIEQGAQAPRFWDIFTGSTLKTTALATLLTMGILGGNYNILTWLPTYLRTVRHLSVTNTGAFLLVNILGSWMGYVIGGYIADWLGRRWAFVLCACGAIITVIVYMFGAVNNTMILILGFPLGFFASATNAGVGAFLSELFPSRLRGTAQGFSYNAGRGIGAMFPFLVGVFSDKFALGPVVGIVATTAYSLVIIAAIALPETKAKELAVYA
ncbi:MAG TPA: MFS transporter [Candidatus Binatia bacterium]|nr:MFS transporter [Candidatus Binatia bacterium]